MNNWKLRSVITGTNADDLVEVNGHLSAPFNNDVPVLVVPFGDLYAASIRTTASDTFGPVSNQVPGICNGTFTHTGSGSATVSATTLTGEGSGATFTYTFLADGTLSTITANTGGSNYKVGDKLRITTSGAHGSQVIEFRLVDGSNSVSLGLTIPHDRTTPLPFAVHRARVNNASEHTFHVFDYRSQQVFPRPQDKLLDKYPDAAAAYGLRKLRSAYLGPAIRVRSEASGFPEIDVYFDGAGNLDTKALLDFAGTNSVRVKTWYDQSGGGNDATQGTNATQPTIVGGGVLRTVNGKPALDFDGSDDKFLLNHSDLYGQSRLDVYMHLQSTDDKFVLFRGDGLFKHDGIAEDGSNSTTVFRNFGSPEIYVNGVDIDMTYGTTTRDLYHKALITDGASHSNGAILVQQGANSNVSSAEWTEFQVSGYGGAFFAGKMTELVLYNTDQSANRENIEKDMALYSGAYQVEDAPLLDAYGGAHAAYSLRKLNSDYTGAAIRVVSVTGSQPYAEQDIGFDANGNLDEAALTAFAQNNANIKTWYDQSGNGKNVTAPSLNEMPKIMYANGTVVKVGEVPAALFSGAQALPFDNTGLDVGNLSSFAVMKYSNLDNQQMGLGLSGASGDKRWYAPYLNSGDFKYGYKNNTAAIDTTANTNNNLHSMIAGATQGDVEAFLNGTSAGTTTLTTGISVAAGIGNLGGSFQMNGFIQEVIVYSSDQSQRRLGIERNISNHYDL